ncbi:MAG: hypothetical protein DRN12_05845 [Thermoplasmata archaeon]|nr:MAG: hypothetical protein DRN12_05845 [Thermoplasmata archaeon]
MKIKTIIQSILIVGIILSSIIPFTGCISGTIKPFDNPTLPLRGFYMGILPTVARNQSFEDGYKQASEYAEFTPIWSSGIGAEGFWDYADKLKGWQGNIFLKKYIRGNGMFPIIHFSFMDKNEAGELILKTPENMKNATLNNSVWRKLYKKSIFDVVKVAHPLYLSIGNEVNRWYEEYGVETDNPNGFQHFVTLYEEIYDEIKKFSPDTYVFCVFSREIVSENREANLDVLKMFDPDKIDILVFTSYPFALPGINRPSDIPDDYYLTVAQYLPGKPFGFSELGWPSREEFGGEEAQAEFLYRCSSNLTVDQGIDLHLFGYCWLHDLNENDTLGLIRYGGSEKIGYQAWKEISQS